MEKNAREKPWNMDLHQIKNIAWQALIEEMERWNEFQPVFPFFCLKQLHD